MNNFRTVIHDIQQGTQKWREYRATHLNASELPIVMGVSPYRTRTDLVRSRATGVEPEVDARTALLFQRGHEFEAIARKWAEDMLDDVLYPIVLSAEVDGLPLSASLDGQSLDGSVIYEHKTGGADLLASLEAGVIPEHYHPQMEQCLMLSGAKRCLFMASSGVLEAMRFAWYDSRPELRAQIIPTWRQFVDDVRAYVAPMAAAPVANGARPESLPALRINVTGMVTASNLNEFKAVALTAIRAVNRDLQSDQDFADATEAIKWCADVESRLKAAKEHILGQTGSIDDALRVMNDISEEARRTRLDVDKLVEARKLAIRTEIVTSAQAELDGHVLTLNGRLGSNWIGRVAGNFGEAIKGKKTVASVRDACSVALANAKIEASAKADRLDFNRKGLIHGGDDWMFLFADFAQAGDADAATFSAVAEQRIAKHKEAQAEAQRKREAEAAALVVPALVAPVAPVAAPEVRPSVVSAPAALPPRNLLLVDLESSDVLHALILHIGIARHGKFPTAPKVGAEWWSRLYKLSDELAVEVAA